MENKNMIENELDNVTGGIAFVNNYYTLQNGETLNAVAYKFNTTVAMLMSLNPHIKNANHVSGGDTIRIR